MRLQLIRSLQIEAFKKDNTYGSLASATWSAEEKNSLVEKRFKMLDPKSSIFCIASEGMGSYGEPVLTRIFQLAFPEKKIVWLDRSKAHKTDKTLEVDLIVQSHFFGEEAAFCQDLPYICWSGEPRRVDMRRSYAPIFHAITSTKERDNDIILPYALFANNEPDPLKFRKYTHTERSYFCCYIARNPVRIRELLFEILRATVPGCHALGVCQRTEERVIQAGWCNNPEVFKDYYFAFALENCILDNYVTEKIINAFLAGCIPIFWGHSATAKRLFNTAAYIDISDFQTIGDAVDHIITIYNDPVRRTAMMTAPVFKDNILPDDFLWHSGTSTEVQKAIHLLRTAFNIKITQIIDESLEFFSHINDL